MEGARGRFTRPELALVGTAAAILFTRIFAFSLTAPGFTAYAQGLMPGSEAGTAALLAGIALGAYGLTMALAQLGTGILSDRLGRRRLLVAGTLVFVLGAAVCALATDIHTLIAGRLLQGLGGVSSVALAAVGETVPESRRTSAMALVGIPAGLAVFLGFLLGPWAAPLVGFTGLFWAAGALGLLAGLPILLRPMPSPLASFTRVASAAGRWTGASMAALGLAATGFTVNFAMSAVMFGFEGEVLARIGQGSLAALLLGALVVMALASRIVDRTGTAWQASLLALAVLVLAAPLFRLGDGLALVLLAGLAFFAAHATLSALLPSQVSRISGPRGGRGHGLQLQVSYLGTFAGAAFAGLFASHPGDAFLLLATAGAAAAITLWAGARRGTGPPTAVAPGAGM